MSEIQCPDCNGEGRIKVWDVIGCVSDTMAADAGNSQYAGEPVCGWIEMTCETCEGSGLTAEDK